ncbi:MAG: HRDC domain-containing protein [Nocardioides sp.]
MAEDDETTTEAPEATPEAAPLAPLLELRERLPAVVETDEALAATCAAIAGGSGPVAIDAERASGYRYSSRAYLIQLRRKGSGIHLVDPIAFESMSPLQEAIGDAEWILHAATQDLPCLAEVGLQPAALFDTELAGRLLGYPRVGLAALVESRLGFRMAKEHSAVDWSTRPFPERWLVYAALDVEVLVELRELLGQELVEAGKDGWAAEEFDALRGFAPTPRVDAWRRTSGLHRVRGRRSLGAVRGLYELRDHIARERDVTPGRILPDSAIVAAATAMPLQRRALLRTQGFHGRGAERYAARWTAVLQEVAELPEEELPTRVPRGDGPPTPRTWAEKDPVAARRLSIARPALAVLSDEHHVPVENLLTPDYVRRILWSPPATREPEALASAVGERLADYGARRWQRDLTTGLLVEAILAADVAPPPLLPAPPADA